MRTAVAGIFLETEFTMATRSIARRSLPTWKSCGAAARRIWFFTRERNGGWIITVSLRTTWRRAQRLSKRPLSLQSTNLNLPRRERRRKLEATSTFSGMTEFEIRTTTKADVPVILSLIRELATYERAPDAVVATEAGLRDVLFGAKPSAEVLLALENNEAVGFAVFFHNFSTWLGRPGLYLEDLFVKPEDRGKGYGRALLVALAKVARERSCGRMEWAVLDWNEPAIEFYRKLGAKPMDEWTVFRLTRDGIVKLADTTQD